MAALLADDLKAKPAVSVEEVAQRWIDRFWATYSVDFADSLKRARELSQKGDPTPHIEARTYDSLPPGDKDQLRTPEDQKELLNLLARFSVGFCIGGYCLPDRNPKAYSIAFSPAEEKPQPLNLPRLEFWGAPNVMVRLLLGSDENLINDVMNSGKWSGTKDELQQLRSRNFRFPPYLPIRDAIDFVHAGIYGTIKGFKFANLAQICGGPIEIAVITSDRHFRWVRHKKLFDEAIAEQESHNRSRDKRCRNQKKR